ncbi:MAG TPA: hypothetical protein VGH73_15650 [Thermoanaerobaculia bacterium]|jgi:hypothetical protein
MTQRSIRRTTIAAVLAAALAVATPAHAASRQSRAAGPGWIEAALQWVAHVWPGNPISGLLKVGVGIDPEGSTTPAGASSDYGGGIDPDGLKNTSTPLPPLPNG